MNTEIYSASLYAEYPSFRYLTNVRSAICHDIDKLSEGLKCEMAHGYTVNKDGEKKEALCSRPSGTGE